MNQATLTGRPILYILWIGRKLNILIPNSRNYNLKIIAGMVGVRIPITLYCARHSWASAAKAKGIPVSVISEGMGHDSESTTQIYLASLDNSVVDKANAIILKSI